MKKLVCGIDEVGRGAVAGPLVIASVVFKKSKKIPYNIRDSKKTTFIQRKLLFREILNNAYVGVGCIDSQIIDKLGITEATRLGIAQCISNNISRKDIILLDGNIKIDSKYKVKSINKGDNNFVSIAAASIIAKFIRDNIMILKSNYYPNYNWKNNKGYGTKDHLLAIKLYGITNYHRKSFKLAH